jgi:ABC-type tungstate transport system permease subunit
LDACRLVTASASFNTEMKTELTLNLGPKSNPANLSTTESDSIYDLFTQLVRACIETQNSKNPIRFLSRYDKSAANIKESSIWTAIGQTPWSYPPSTWYHTCVDFPFRALEVTALLGEYSLVDKGTWWSVEPWIREKLMIFVRTLFHSS